MASGMLTLKTFHRKTKKGSVIKVVREHYLRKDISCGWISCTRCPKEDRSCLSDDPRVGLSTKHSAHFVIPDSDVILDQMDIFEDEVFGNEVIILQTVLNDVRSRNIKVYSKLRELISLENRCFYVFCNEYHADTYVERLEKESMTDYVDRLINSAVDWYREHFKAADFVILSSKPNKNRYMFEEYIRGHVKSNHLLDKLKQTEAQLNQENEEAMEVDESCLDSKKKVKDQEPPEKDMKFLYPIHLSPHDILAGVKKGTIFEGKYLANPRNSLEGMVSIPRSVDEELQVLILGRMNVNRAIDQDIVAIELLPESEWICESGVILEPGDEVGEDVIENAAKEATKSKNKKPTGRVVGIVRRKFRQMTGSLKKSINVSSSIVMVNHLFVPKDGKLPLIRIETRQYDILKDQRIVVAFDSWPRDSKYPKGHYVRALGQIADMSAEKEAVLIEFDVKHDSFTKNVLKCLPQDPDNWKIPESEYQSRTDFRDYLVCSVDPEGCTDIDDALHCRQLPSGDLEVGVHIADVGYFVKENSALDIEAAKRGTTVYLMDTRIDMIPGVLSSNLASLREGVERLTFSVVWIIDPETAEIKETSFSKSIIKSVAAMTYAQAQGMIDSKSNDGLSESLRRLNSLAKKIRQKRMEKGALELASGGEITFADVESETHEDPNRLTKEIKKKELVEANSMVEEFMVLANISVAKRILEDFPEISVLRRHQQPPAKSFEELRAMANKKGFDIDPSSGKVLNDSLKKADDPKDPFFNTILRMLTTRCMTQALYFCTGSVDSETKHFGLAADRYTHFTSPIRRYADIMVHRLLAACINACPLDPSLMNKNKVTDICDNLNFRKRNGQLAQRESKRLHTVNYIKMSGKVLREEAHVLEVKNNAIVLFLKSFSYNQTYFTEAPDWTYCPEEMAQVHVATGIKIQIFDRVQINIGVLRKETDYRRSEQLEVLIVDPPVDQPLTSSTRKQEVNQSAKKKMKTTKGK